MGTMAAAATATQAVAQAAPTDTVQNLFREQRTTSTKHLAATQRRCHIKFVAQQGTCHLNKRAPDKELEFRQELVIILWRKTKHDHNDAREHWPRPIAVARDQGCQNNRGRIPVGFLSLDFIAMMVAVIGTIAFVLMGYLTYKIYTSNEPKQRASIEPEVDDNNELT
jgi:hypothetical protein